MNPPREVLYPIERLGADIVCAAFVRAGWRVEAGHIRDGWAVKITTTWAVTMARGGDSLLESLDVAMDQLFDGHAGRA